MNIIDMKIEDYLRELKTKSPAPGGGSASGISGVQGIALTLMVTDLTIGNEKYKEHNELNKKVAKEGLIIYNKLKKAADNDKEAFLKLSEAYKLPRNTEEEKAERKRIIGEKSKDAIEAPFEVMELCKEALSITSLIVGKSNTMASSDLGVAAANLLSASKSAWLNVKINIPYLNDRKKAEKFFLEGRKLLEEIESVADLIYSTVEKGL